MKYISIILLLTLFACNSESINEQELVGQWRVNDVLIQYDSVHLKDVEEWQIEAAKENVMGQQYLITQDSVMKLLDKDDKPLMTGTWSYKDSMINFKSSDIILRLKIATLSQQKLEIVDHTFGKVVISFERRY